jgi:hypothetical protein
MQHRAQSSQPAMDGRSTRHLRGDTSSWSDRTLFTNGTAATSLNYFAIAPPEHSSTS